jgi:hypothetical protein
MSDSCLKIGAVHRLVLARWALFAGLAMTCMSYAVTGHASPAVVRGKIVITQGHESPACRMVELKRNDTGTFMWFRIPATGVEDGILAVTMTALTTNLNVDITYDTAITSGCGSEPKISYISLVSPAAP